jgi:hypothetical protein
VRTVKLPADGVYRAGRWQDVDRFPAPAPAIALPFTSPLCTGSRWEDVSAGFATIKCSRSAEAAIGRTIARYRPRTIPPQGSGMIAALKHFFSEPPDEGEPALAEGIVPRDMLTSLYLIHIPGSVSPSFVDIEHESTGARLEQVLGESVEGLGLGSIEGNDLAREPDRRLTRLVLRALHDLCADEDVAGVRIPGQLDEAWESYVVWSSPPLIDPARDRDELRWVSPMDPDLIRAAKALGLRLPYG